MSSYFWCGIHCVFNMLLLVIKLHIGFLSFFEDRNKKLNIQIFSKTLLLSDTITSLAKVLPLHSQRLQATVSAIA